MRTDRVPVADGVELVVDTWAPGDGSGVRAAGGAAAATAPGAPTGTAPGTPGLVAFVLVHGLASNARLWDGVAACLAAAGHRVATVDLRGHGRSSKPDGPYDVPTVAADLAAVVARLDLDRPIVAGQSWGGNVVVELAARHPGATRGIVCVDGGWFEPRARFPDWEACLRALAPPRLAGRRLAEVEGHIRAAHPDWPEAGIRATLANFEVRADGRIAPWLTYERHVAVLRGLWDHRPSALFPGLGVPALLVPADTGDTDWTERKVREVEAAAAAIPSVRVRWLDGDHDLHAQHPDELAGAMLEATRDGLFG